MKVAVIGAGMSGAACAVYLQQQGVAVQLFDKGRSAGGRMSSKKQQGYLDLGAQYFTARHADFIAQVAQWQRAGVLEPWSGAIYRYQGGQLLRSSDQQCRYIGVPSMHAPLKAWLAPVSLQLGSQITSLQYHQGWQLQSAQGEIFGAFDYLVLALPAAQAKVLLEGKSLLADQIEPGILQPCWAVNLQLVAPSGHTAGGIFVKDGAVPLSWLARQNSKPGRLNTESWLLHFTPDFSRQHLDTPPAQLADLATSLLARILDRPVQLATASCHRWLYAQQDKSVSLPGLLHDPEQALLVCGDWTLGGRVENAFLSGREAARRVLQHAY
ncbi:NAD(P)/FAD-dependent oxidoreductase [Arsukibacterium sp.]|uniref:NAD(P)/FAD-dependent oxidoreductase n=1 Tax=Arsukibacterium sp. TaxID=1977258 RepID=UPI002FDAFA1A